MRSLDTVLPGGLFRLLPIVFLCLSLIACSGRPSLTKPDPYAEAPIDNGLAGPPVPTRKERKAAQKDWDAVHPVQVEEAEEAAVDAEAEDTKGGTELAQVDELEADPFILEPVNELLAATDIGPPEELQPPRDPCRQMDGNYQSWLDSNQVRLYRTVCGTAAWFDGFFGDRRFDAATGETYGRVAAGGYWDEYEGFNSKIRFRAKYAFPSMRNRGAFFIGRGDEQQLIEGRDGVASAPVPGSGLSEDDSTFIGLGFEKFQSYTRGLSLSVGAKLRAPPEPFVKIKYRRVWELTERDLIRLRPIVYWRSEEGFGTTINLDYDRSINDSLLFRWANFGNVSEEEEVEGVDWGSTWFLLQALSNKQALTYSVFARGETKSEVTFKNAGFEIRFRQNFLRDWLFVEYVSGLSWPRVFLEERRKTNFGIGLFLEAYFGPAPDEYMGPRF